MGDFADSAWGQIKQGKSLLHEPHSQTLEDPAVLDGCEFVGSQFIGFLVAYKSGSRGDRFLTLQVPAQYRYLTDELITVPRKWPLSVDVQRWRRYVRAVTGVDPGQADGYLPDDV